MAGSTTPCINPCLNYVGDNFEIRTVKDKPKYGLAGWYPVHCYKCKANIEPGEQYYKDVELDHGYKHTYCLECGEEIRRMRREVNALWNEEEQKDEQKENDPGGYTDPETGIWLDPLQGECVYDEEWNTYRPTKKGLATLGRKGFVENEQLQR